MDIIARIKKHEGYRLDAYKDSLGIWTIGVGFNLERAGANEALKRAGVNPDLIWESIEACNKRGGGRKPGDRTGEAVLTDEQVNRMLAADVATSTADCYKLCPDMNTWPADARMVLIDLHFNMGAKTMRTFKNTLKAFNAKDWKLAADNLTKSKWFTQVGRRATENVALLRAL